LRYREALRDCFKGITPRLDCEYRVRHSDGAYRWIDDRAVPVRNEAGRAVRLVGAVSDITERKQAEQALLETTQSREALLNDLNAVIDTIDYGVLFMGPDLRARVVNRAFRRMWGIPDEFIAAGPDMADLINYNRHNGIYPVPESEFDAYVARRVKAIREGDITPVEMHRADGMILRYGGMALPDGGRLLTYFDITESKRREAELREALEHQTAIAEVLKAISRSAIDLDAILHTVVTSAIRLCRADQAVIYRNVDGVYRWANGHSLAPEYERIERNIVIRPGPGSVVGRAASQGRTVQIEDAWTDPLYEAKEDARIGGIRSVMGVPLLRDGAVIGVIGLARRRIEPYSEREIELVTTFADQAVIAIENARLLTETREALEQQTATAEVLQVINSSPGNLAPVFDAMLEKVLRLCEASYGMLWTYDGEYFRVTAQRNIPPALQEFLSQPIKPGPGTSVERVIGGASIVHTADVRQEAAYREGHPRRRAMVELGGARAGLTVALRQDGKLLGVFVAYRQEVRPFTGKHIALLQSFAAQAVVAMENARLLIELRDRTRDLQESLEYQTSISEVLQVISRSTLDLDAVLKTVVNAAARLCGADHAGLYRDQDGEYCWAAGYNQSPEYERIERNVRIAPGPGTLVGRTAQQARPVQISDAQTDSLYEPKQDARAGQVHSMLGVPLLREGSPIGVIGLARTRIEPFTPSQVQLVSTFADQAVIAIENARLLTEIRQRQAELRVTFDNMGDGVAMFDAQLRLAAWNHNFQQMLNLPDAFLEARPSFAEYFDYLSKRGEYGSAELEAQLRHDIEDTARKLRFERTRPDGRVIEVRRNAVPGGGFVLIYSDVTERKRAEADIRAARDAAEQALSDLKAAQASLLHAQKMSALGQLTAGIAHEIKNPLNFVNNFSALSNELLVELKEIAAPAFETLDDDSRADIDETIDILSGNLEKIAEHGKRADNIVKSMLAHSRGSSGERTRTDLNALVDEALNLAYHGARAHDQNFNITMERDFDKSLAPIELVPQDMMRVFINLIGNGFHAAHKRRQETGEAGFRPVLRVATRNLGNAVEVRVRDNGSGIRPEHRDKLFQPFFTTKPTGEGTGLGLSISYDIVTQQHGGTITVESEPDMFTEFTVYLPRADGTATGRAA
jgi:GAF domain-containing protein